MVDKCVYRYLIALVALAVAFPVHAQNYDPMRPQGQGMSQQVAASDTPLRLTSIVVSEQRKVAVINGRAVTVGDAVEHYRVVRISPQEVCVQRGDKQLVLRLASVDAAQAIKRKITE